MIWCCECTGWVEEEPGGGEKWTAIWSKGIWKEINPEAGGNKEERKKEQEIKRRPQ